jgi:endonuclease/exonuclease/phosphatase family metal-dependent hydrolase
MKKILVISTHLHYRENTDDTASSDDNARVRRYEIRLLLAWIEAKSQELDFQSIVILGDMNSHYLTGTGKTTMDVFKDAGYSRTFDTAITTGDTDGTLATNGRTTRPEWIFDYILTKGRVYTNYYSVVPNMNDKGNTAYPSDHLPIMARITCY